VKSDEDIPEPETRDFEDDEQFDAGVLDKDLRESLLDSLGEGYQFRDGVLTVRNRTSHSELALQGAITDPDPTDAKKAAGNYRKGRIKWNGLKITVENPRGSIRSGTGPEGPWSVTMPAHYGYVLGTEGRDGDQVDVYLGQDVDSQAVFVVDQHDPKTGAFDEHKVMLGCQDRAHALALYDAAFSDGSGPARRRTVTQISADDFKDWLRAGDTNRPSAESLWQPIP
jgi:hypothetical protein